MFRTKCIFYILVFLFVMGCKDKENKPEEYTWKPMKVTATAYNSFPSQTSYEHPGITAWGDSLMPGMKYIAVSRDLIAKGFTHNAKVKIDRLEGVYLVKDKMHGRWKNRIDIYMGVDEKAALRWGRKRVWVQIAIKKDSVPEVEEIK